MKKTNYLSQCHEAPIELDDSNPNWKYYICTECGSKAALKIEDLMKEAA